MNEGWEEEMKKYKQAQLGFEENENRKKYKTYNKKKCHKNFARTEENVEFSEGSRKIMKNEVY